MAKQTKDSGRRSIERHSANATLWVMVTWFVLIALGLALMTKLQSIAFAPLFLFDVYRWQRWRGVGVLTLGGLAAAVCIGAPFAFSGSLPTALQRGYVDVIGQYERLSINAFNPWQLTGTPDFRASYCQ